MIEGYKAFANDYTTLNNMKLDEGKKYHQDGIITFGSTKGNGFHFAKKLEDTIRYTPRIDDCLHKPKIAKVIGFGTIIEGYDDYYEYYEMYAASDIEIISYLTEKQIIEYALKLEDMRLFRFISQYKLTEEQIELFIGRSKYIDNAINYYQKKLKKTYELKK